MRRLQRPTSKTRGIRGSCFLVKNQVSLTAFRFAREPSLQTSLTVFLSPPLAGARVSTHSEHQRTRNWTADIAKNGSDFLADKTIISDFVTHKNFVIRFASDSGATITDEYLTG